MDFSWPHRTAGRRRTARVWIVGASAVALAGAAALAAPGAFASTASSHATAKDATTTTMSGASGSVGSKIKLTAKVKGGSTPTGWVKFIYDGKKLCSAPLSKGTADCPAVFGVFGSLRVEAYYEGNSTHTTSHGFATVKVAALAAKATVTASPDPEAGVPVTLTAVVAPSAATGTVTFYDAGGELADPVRVSGGEASLSYTWDAAATYKVTAVYSGDATHTGSSGTIAVTVALDATTTEITNPFPTYEPEGTTQTVDVEVLNNNPDGPAPTGTVTVTTDAPGADNAGLPDGVVYSCTVENLTPLAGTPGASTGNCPITGVGYGFLEVEGIYTQNDEFATSTSTGEHKFINLLTTVTTVATADGTDEGIAGDDVTLVGTVNADVLAGASDPGYGPANPDTITFTVTGANGTATCENVALTGDGDATNSAECTVNLPAGTYTVTAAFAGDEYSAPSTGTATLTIEAAGDD